MGQHSRIKWVKSETWASVHISSRNKPKRGLICDSGAARKPWLRPTAAVALVLILVQEVRVLTEGSISFSFHVERSLNMWSNNSVLMSEMRNAQEEMCCTPRCTQHSTAGDEHATSFLVPGCFPNIVGKRHVHYRCHMANNLTTCARFFWGEAPLEVMAVA